MSPWKRYLTGTVVRNLMKEAQFAPVEGESNEWGLPYAAWVELAEPTKTEPGHPYRLVGYGKSPSSAAETLCEMLRSWAHSPQDEVDRGYRQCFDPEDGVIPPPAEFPRDIPYRPKYY